MNFVIAHSYLIPLLPLLGAIVAGLFGAKVLKGASHWPIWLGVGAAAVMSLTLLVGLLGRQDVVLVGGAEHAAAEAAHAIDSAAGFPLAHVSHWFDWIVAGDDTGAKFNASAGAFIDPLTAVMLSVVCGIGFLITVFAAGYMKGEAGYFRFFAYLGLFIFAMTCLVLGDNLVMLYLGWEGVGVCSYLLVGYYYDKPSAREAAKKAFIVNRVGDFGFALGIFLVFYAFGTISYFGDGPGLVGPAFHKGFIEMALNPSQYVPIGRLWALEWILFCLMLGAFGKSAQFPLYVWLPDAMEGPTPVSALIHAATMVTAGVYMIARLSTLFVPHHAAMVTIAVVGAFTALFAGSIALKQNDLKKVFAYSTVSQLGYMFVAVAVLNPVAAVFHLVTHAFFKALLFLSSGVVMHATGGELDLRKMSGMKKVLPKTNILMLIGCLALAGFPLLAGFWSKDEIVSAASGKSTVLWMVMLLTSLLTAYYTFRLYFRVFQGPELVPHGEHGHGHAHDAEEAHAHADHHHNHEPFIMIAPLAILAIGALFAGIINLPFGAGVSAHSLGHFLSQSPSFAYGYAAAEQTYHGGQEVDAAGFGQASQEALSVTPLVVGGVVALLGIAMAYALHLQNRKKGDQLAVSLAPIGHAMERKYWIDELFQGAIVEPLRAFGKVFLAIDKYVVDGAVAMVAFVPQVTGFGLKLATQRGYLQGYALGMLMGVAVILLWVFA
ncbi:MAG: nuoL [Phycisphaerales bacterium]|nr:nuoL [Phycisphaerales bacterium]